MKTALKVVLLFLLCSAGLWAAPSPSPWYVQDDKKNIIINVELFLSSTCPHCLQADSFFTNSSPSSAYIHVQRNFVNQDKNALIRFNQLLSAQKMDDFAVPSIYFCNSRWVGFASAQTTGKDLLHAINYCKQQIEKQGSLTQATIDTLRHWANANKFDAGMTGAPSAVKYITTMALTDAFAPCAFFGFAGFLAFIFLGENRKKQILAGSLFIISIVMTHYYQQAHASSFYQLLPWLRLPAVLIGALGIYFVIQYYRRQYDNRLYYFLSFLFGFIITAYQQICVMNWSYIFEQWLNNQNLFAVQSSFYQLFYQIIYILPLISIIIIYLCLLRVTRIAALQPRLVLVALLFLLAISFCLIIFPLALSHAAMSVFTLLILLVCAHFLNWA